MKLLGEFHASTGAKKVLNSELWHSCAGPLVSLPQPGTLVLYFPQGHSEQVSSSTRRNINSQIPSYSILPSQLMCQVHNVTLHADRESDEVYAQILLQPVNSEADVFQIPDFGYTKSMRPTEFFCKSLTASDTSTHGGFSVPRRAAEKLFPPLDYTMQPPNQELSVRDLHDNIWTFRHIYRGQPKRHLLTTGWSLFVGAKRLKAGDSVLFIRDEKSQLLLGLRRANSQLTTFPSSVLSADSMHIGVLAAAAHAVASRNSFTVYYNPKACPSEFIIPLAKYHKAAFMHVSAGMRFGMMFATEELIKRRTMGTIVGVSDLDSLRWPNSKWRNLEVEWDEPSSDDKPDRVSIWEIEAPESLFVVPSCLKRHCNSGFVEYISGNRHILKSNLDSERLIKSLKPRNHSGREIGFSESVYGSILKNIKANDLHATSSSALPSIMTSQGDVLHEAKKFEIVKMDKKIPLFLPEQPLALEETSFECKNTYHCLEQQRLLMETKRESQFSSRTSWRSCQVQNVHDNCYDGVFGKEKVTETFSVGSKKKRIVPTQNKVETTSDLTGNSERPKTATPRGNEIIKKETFRSSVVAEDKESQATRPVCPLIYQQELEKSNSWSNKNFLNSLPHQEYQLYHYSDTEELTLRPSLYQSIAESLNIPDDFTNSSRPDHVPISALEDLYPFEACHFSSSTYSFTSTYTPIVVEEAYNFQDISPHDAENIKNDAPESLIACGLRDLSNEGTNPSETCSNLHSNSSNADAFTISSVPSTVIEEFCVVEGSSLPVLLGDHFDHFATHQDMQSQLTSTSLSESHVFSLREFPDNSVSTSSGNFYANDCSYFGKLQMKQVVQQPMRTYTKVQKLGSVGRSVDLKRFQNYEELKSAIACMFGLEGLHNNHKHSEWKFVYLDQENDVLLLGDDPWDEFVNCVRCIRILSLSEVEQMSQEGLQFINRY